MSAILVGFITGMLSAFGIGGGTLLLIWLTVFLACEPSLAAGVNLLYFLPCASLALFSHFKNGLVEKSALLPAVLGGVIVAALASFVASGIDTSMLRKIFGVFLIAIAVASVRR